MNILAFGIAIWVDDLKRAIWLMAAVFIIATFASAFYVWPSYHVPYMRVVGELALRIAISAVGVAFWFCVGRLLHWIAQRLSDTTKGV